MKPAVLIAIAIGALLVALLAPQVIDGFVDDSEHTVLDKFTGVGDATSTQVVALSQLPNDATTTPALIVKVNRTPVPLATAYTYNPTPNAVTLLTQVSEAPDDITVGYTYTGQLAGQLGTVWAALPVILVVALIVGYLGFGVLKQSDE